MLLRQGIDLQDLISRNVGRAWNVLYSLAVENLDKKQKEQFDSDVFRRPAGETRMVGDSVDLALAQGAAAYAKSLERARSAIDSEGEKSEGR